MPATTGRLRREARLTDKPQFDRVYREGQRVSDALFTVVASANGLGHARLGLSVGIRAAGRAWIDSTARRRAESLVAHAREHSPLYREHYRELAPDSPLEDLPPLR